MKSNAVNWKKLLALLIILAVPKTQIWKTDPRNESNKNEYL